jgi:predicted transcriptional regulator of viral defense system
MEVTLMAPRQAGRLPTPLLHRPLRVLRPQDAAGAYAHPRPEFARLVKTGVLHRLATGYYAIVPDDRIGLPWLPDLESSALGMAASDEGAESVALMGISAARVHGAAPRALGVAVVAASRHRAPIRLADRDADVIFVRRNVSRIDVERRSLELGQGWVTTIEQTIIDLAGRPDLGHVPDEADGAVRALLPRADRDFLRRLATSQRRTALVDQIMRDA